MLICWCIPQNLISPFFACDEVPNLYISLLYSPGDVILYLRKYIEYYFQSLLCKKLISKNFSSTHNLDGIPFLSSSPSMTDNANSFSSISFILIKSCFGKHPIKSIGALPAIHESWLKLNGPFIVHSGPWEEKTNCILQSDCYPANDNFHRLVRIPDLMPPPPPETIYLRPAAGLTSTVVVCLGVKYNFLPIYH